jgi:hypothetical protein
MKMVSIYYETVSKWIIVNRIFMQKLLNINEELEYRKMEDIDEEHRNVLTQISMYFGK